MDIKNSRNDFPLLTQENPVIYLDNACSTLRPRAVIQAVQKYYEEYPVCAGRGVYGLSKTVSEKCEETRREVANFINAQMAREIVFTRNTTEAINLVANCLDFKEGDVILTSDKEHNSNLLPWQMAEKKRGIVYKIVPTKEDNTFDLSAFEAKMRGGGVKLVALGLTSNLDGVTIPVKEIIKIAHENGALVLLDAAQAVPHQEINVSKLDVDFLAFSGHKMMGPSGTGVLYGKAHLLEKLSPFMLGGATVKNSYIDKDFELSPVPERFEAGLQNYAGIVGLGEAIRYIKKIGFENIKEQERKLNEIVTNGIKDIPNLKIIGPQDPAQRGGIISLYFDSEDFNGHGIAYLLDKKYNICVRSGRHCVHSWFNSRGIKGSLRASFYFYNTEEEAKKFVDALKSVDIKEANKQPVQG
ncbi:cysteine desulfurase, partial [Patescibacteria group bacterium]|nr:cysteine desulfurase [Patescibacteria group bacterium]